jgi:hypothetical protein
MDMSIRRRGTLGAPINKWTTDPFCAPTIRDVDDGEFVRFARLTVSRTHLQSPLDRSLMRPSVVALELVMKNDTD